MIRAEMLAAEFNMNNASPQAMTEHKLGSRLVKGQKHIAKFSYDFAKQGGAIGTIGLKNEDGTAASLPKGAIVQNGVIDVITAPTSGGSATVSFSTGKTAADLKAATAIASITGLVATIPVGTAGTSIKLTADTVPSIVVAVAALTAGKFYVIVEFTLSDST
jgi:hypothetical protein